MSYVAGMVAVNRTWWALHGDGELCYRAFGETEWKKFPGYGYPDV